MNASQILPILLAMSTVVGIIVAVRSRRKEGPQKVQELCQHLTGIGMEASTSGEPASQTPIGGARSWGQKPLGTIRLVGGNVDSINVVGVASQYGVSYYLDYVVRVSSFAGPKKKTRMVKKRTSFLGGKVADIEWRGDDLLAQRLSHDYQLRERLLDTGPDALKGSVAIVPEAKQDYARIRVGYSLPTRRTLETIDMIAKHIRA